VRLTVRRGGSTVAIMEPSKRLFTVRQTATTEAAIETLGLSQLYASLGDLAPDNSVTVRVYWKPLVTLIWIGPIIMALGGALSLSDRRLRIGAPRPARRSAPVPAE
jgi:cytochrome c-type biogenesis protein CcmF